MDVESHRFLQGRLDFCASCTPLINNVDSQHLNLEACISTLVNEALYICSADIGVVEDYGSSFSRPTSRVAKILGYLQWP